MLLQLQQLQLFRLTEEHDHDFPLSAPLLPYCCCCCFLAVLRFERPDCVAVQIFLLSPPPLLSFFVCASSYAAANDRNEQSSAHSSGSETVLRRCACANGVSIHHCVQIAIGIPGTRNNMVFHRYAAFDAPSNGWTWCRLCHNLQSSNSAPVCGSILGDSGAAFFVPTLDSARMAGKTLWH